MQQTLKKGILIAIEGIDGSGKSTLANSIALSLSEKVPTLLTKEPGATELGKKLRSLLQEQTIPLTPKAEYLLFAADRAHHFATFVIPALNEKKLVLSDRMADSSLVYQGYGRGLDLNMLTTINAWAMDNYAPHLVLYVRIDPKIARERLIARGKLSAFEQEQESFTHTLVRGFDTIFKNRTNVILLDGNQTPQAVAAKALEEIITWINRNALFV